MTPTRLALLSSLLAAPMVRGQVQLEPQPAPPAIRKIVVHDQGGSWPTAVARHDDGSLTALGNPWLGSSSCPILGVTGVQDLARLDALHPGDSESLAAVGTHGLTTMRWDATSRAFVVTPFVDAALAGAPIVRTAAFAPFHLISVVTADRTTVRSYRGTGPHLSTVLSTTPIRDLELFKSTSGSARLVVRTDTDLTCCGLNGATLWQVAGTGGLLVRLPRTTTARVAWLHQSANAWRVAMLGDEGLVATYPLDHAFAPTTTLVAAFAADADRDGDCDLVVKSSAGVCVLAAPADGDFGLSAVTWHTQIAPSATSVPDLIPTHAGQRLRYVDEFGSAGVDWERVELSPQSLMNASEDSLSLEVVDHVGGTVVSSTPGTRIAFGLRTTPSALAPLLAPNTQLRLQIVAWAQDDLTGPGTKMDLSESNLLLTLSDPPQTPQTDWLWPAYVDLQPDCTANGWELERYYWLTVRLCQTPVGSEAPTLVSEPITLVASMSKVQGLAGWPFLTTYYFPGVTQLPIVTNPPPPGTFFGGGVVGVIQRADSPPPPPPSGIPTPRANTAQATITGQPAEQQ